MDSGPLPGCLEDKNIEERYRTISPTHVIWFLPTI